MQLEMEELGKISNQFPYFGAAQIILARAYQQRGDYRYTDQLHQAAVYANDRHVLYNWVKKSSGTFSEPQAHDQIEQAIEGRVEVETTSPQVITPSAEIIIENGSELAALILNDDEKLHDAPQETERIASSVASIIEVVPDIIQEVQEETDLPKFDISAMDPLQQQILVEALHRSMEAEVTPEHPILESANDKKQLSEEDLESPDSNSYAAWMLKRSRALHFGDDAATRKVEEDIPAGAQDWIRKPQEPNTEASEREQVIDPPAMPASLSHGVKRIQVSDSKSHQKDLIDRFIQHEPNISRGKISEYSAGNIAKDSLEEDFSMVTETIAQLFAKQGKFDKARKAYRKLIELYPEKSVYFAAQLKNLDKLKK